MESDEEASDFEYYITPEMELVHSCARPELQMKQKTLALPLLPKKSEEEVTNDG